ncbi:MAG: hypothetical protein ACOY4I_15100 [Bacillota bacterium]
MKAMIPQNPEDININASQQGMLEIAEHFFRQKMRLKKDEENEKDKKNIFALRATGTQNTELSTQNGDSPH